MLRVRRSRAVVAFIGFGLALSGFLLWPGEGSGAGVSGMVEATKLEVGYYPGQGSLRVQVHLISGLVAEYRAESQRDADFVMQISQAYAQRGVRLFVELSEDQVLAFWLVTGGSGSGSGVGGSR